MTTDVSEELTTTIELPVEERSTVAQALVIGLTAVLVTLIFATALRAVVRTQTQQDLRQQILHECAQRDYPTPPTCIGEMRKALES